MIIEYPKSLYKSWEDLSDEVVVKDEFEEKEERKKGYKELPEIKLKGVEIDRLETNENIVEENYINDEFEEKEEHNIIKICKKCGKEFLPEKKNQVNCNECKGKK